MNKLLFALASMIFIPTLSFAADFYCTCTPMPCTCHNLTVGDHSQPQMSFEGPYASPKGDVVIPGSYTTVINVYCRLNAYENGVSISGTPYNVKLSHSSNISCTVPLKNNGGLQYECTNWDVSNSKMQVPYFSCH